MQITGPVTVVKVSVAARCGGRFGKSTGDRVAMEADRVDGLFATCADTGDDVVGVFSDRAARCGRRFDKSTGD